MHHTLLSFGLVIVAGAIFRRLHSSSAATVRHSINLCVFNVFLPALCLRIFYTARVDAEALLVPLTAVLTICASLALAWMVYVPLSKRLKIGGDETGILIIGSAFGNVTYLGLPVITELYGFEASKYPIYYDLLATTPILWLVGAQVACRFGSCQKMPGSKIRDSIRTIVSLPPLWGCLLGVVLQVGHIPLPEFVLKALTMLGGLVVTLMIFSIGLAITMPKVKHAAAAAPAALIKLAVSPILGYAFARAVGVQGIALKSCVIEGAMPVMVLSLLIADRFNLNAPLAAFMIVATTGLSFAVLPIVASIMSGI
ncbi:MAG: AEC family transporter [Nitrospirae bacterium]|nr:AEC family transporter [Nitrospirota bacterium]